MKLKHKLKGLIILLTLFLLSVTVFGGLGNLPASAVTYDNSDVLKDLRTDSSFNVDDFPISGFDYGIYVIQIGESEKGNLYVYTYQPCQPYKKLVATDINMSLSATAEGTKLYELELVSSYDVFAKYLVKDVKVSEAKIRYYNITSIYRTWDKDIDEAPDNDNTVSGKALPVGQVWTVITVNGEVIYSCEDVEVIEVTSQMIGLRRYQNGLEWSGIENCDAHYIAFSCDHEIDRLLSADIAFFTQSYEVSNGKGKLGNDKTKHSKTITASDKGASKKKTWQRMSSTQEFITELNIDGKEKDIISQYDWIINFYETEFKLDNKWWNILTPVLIVNEILSIANGGDLSYLYDISGTFVSDVTLMRLEFEHEGTIYNLGVVSDKQTGSQKPTNSDWVMPEWLQNLVDFIKNIPWWQWVLIGLGLLLGVGLIVAIVIFGAQAVFSFIWWLIKKLFKGLWWLICLPFKGIKALINKIRGE